MKLKYYLRGLGIGIVVTALLMGYSNKNRAAEPKAEVATEETAGDLLADRNGEATTEEVIEQSTVENVTVETDSAETSEEETSQEETASELESSTQEAETITETESVTETETESVQTEETTDKKEQTQSSTEADAGNALPQTTIEINIVRGDDSGTVARKLQNAGMVESATEYDAYLMQHGYDKKIRVGKVEIPVDATWQEIAEYISGKR
jgi:FtsZ-interacting cell division protein ZipA